MWLLRNRVYVVVDIMIFEFQSGSFENLIIVDEVNRLGSSMNSILISDSDDVTSDSDSDILLLSLNDLVLWLYLQAVIVINHTR